VLPAHFFVMIILLICNIFIVITQYTRVVFMLFKNKMAARINFSLCLLFFLGALLLC
jgi:hypothetical protein